MAAQKRIKIVKLNFWHFRTRTNPKPNQSRFATPLTLQDHKKNC